MPGAADRRESEVPGLGHVTDQPGLVKNHDARAGAELTGVEFQLDGMEYNEYRGGDLSERQSSNVFFIDIRVSTRQA